MSSYSEFESISRIDKELHQSLSRFPSIAVSAVINGNVVYMSNKDRNSNVNNEQTNESINIEKNRTAYEIASISKTFLAILALQCQEKGLIDIRNDDINSYLSKRDISVCNPSYPASIITIYHLLTHSSSLLDDESALTEGEWRVPDTDYPRSLEYYVINRLVDNEHLWDYGGSPGCRYHYSNAGFTLLGLVLECATDLSLQAMLREWILQPLGMKHTSYMLSDMQAMEGVTIAVPNEYGRSLGNYGVAEWPACQIRSTIEDMTLYLQDLTSPSSRLISDESRKLLMPESMIEGLAWWGKDATYGAKSGTVWMHGGFMEGIRTHIYIWPSHLQNGDIKGAIILTNGTFSYNSIENALKRGLHVE
jgi:CubicO group peptidase (beta-lactamase class C family)